MHGDTAGNSDTDSCQFLPRCLPHGEGVSQRFRQMKRVLLFALLAPWGPSVATIRPSPHPRQIALRQSNTAVAPF